MPNDMHALSQYAPTKNAALAAWVADFAALVKPDRIHWCDGSDEEFASLTAMMVERKMMLRLDPVKRPRSFLCRSDPRDVARVEGRTFICSRLRSDAGPTNNWVAPAEMQERLRGLYGGAMRGRTLYVVPFSMGPIGSP